MITFHVDHSEYDTDAERGRIVIARQYAISIDRLGRRLLKRIEPPKNRASLFFPVWMAWWRASEAFNRIWYVGVCWPLHNARLRRMP